MKRTVWKFDVPLPGQDGWTKVDLPVGAKMLQAGTQDGQVVLWAAVDPAQTETEERDLLVVKTGTIMDLDVVVLRHLGTFALPQTGVVWHVFKRGPLR